MVYLKAAWPSKRFMLVVVGGMALAGCADARWREANTRRMHRIDSVCSALATREGQSAANLEAVVERIRAGEADHGQRLQADLQRLDEGNRNEVAGWPEAWAQIRTRVDEELAGHPERIEETVARMFY